MRERFDVLREGRFTDHDVRRIAASNVDSKKVKASIKLLGHTSATLTKKAYMADELDFELQQLIEGTYRRKRDVKAAEKQLRV